jgi:uracil-DNA glycosylase
MSARKVRQGGFMHEATERLLREVRACTLCRAQLPLGPRPVFQFHPQAQILIAGQAPGRKVHERGVPFLDASGDRLRDWLGIDATVFYDPQRIALVPMGFCYPGSGKAGDLAPRPECAATWRAKLLARLADLRLTLAVGRYALAWHLGSSARPTLTETVLVWREYGPQLVPLPHPSPRNNIWLKRNPWFERELLPELRGRVRQLLNQAPGYGG